MKWVFVLVVVLVAVYQIGFSSKPGEFDELGNPKTVLFVTDACPPCKDAANYLKRMRVDFELLKLSDPGTEERLSKYTDSRFPLLVVGEEQERGFSKYLYTEALAKNFGLDSLSRRHKSPYMAHFEGERPRVVMYGASWCGYCAKARKEFSEHGIELLEWDVEKNSTAKARFDKLQGSGYPLIYVGFERMHKFDESEVREALERTANPTRKL